MHADVKVLMRGMGFPDAVGVGCEEEEVRGDLGIWGQEAID